MSTNAIFEVRGMTCGHCAKTVEQAARQVPGVTSAKVDLRAGKLMATYDPSTTSATDLAAAVSATGYEAEEIQG